MKLRVNLTLVTPLSTLDCNNLGAILVISSLLNCCLHYEIVPPTSARSQVLLASVRLAPVLELSLLSQVVLATGHQPTLIAARFNVSPAGVLRIEFSLVVISWLTTHCRHSTDTDSNTAAEHTAKCRVSTRCSVLHRQQ